MLILYYVLFITPVSLLGAADISVKRSPVPPAPTITLECPPSVFLTFEQWRNRQKSKGVSPPLINDIQYAHALADQTLAINPQAHIPLYWAGRSIPDYIRALRRSLIDCQYKKIAARHGNSTLICSSPHMSPELWAQELQIQLPSPLITLCLTLADPTFHNTRAEQVLNTQKPLINIFWPSEKTVNNSRYYSPLSDYAISLDIINPTDTFAIFQQKIEQKTGIPPDQQYIVVNNAQVYTIENLNDCYNLAIYSATPPALLTTAFSPPSQSKTSTYAKTISFLYKSRIWQKTKRTFSKHH